MIKHLRKNPKQIAKQEVINVGVQTLVLDESRLAERWPPGLIYEPHEEKKKKKTRKGWPCEFSSNSRWFPLILSTLPDAPAP